MKTKILSITLVCIVNQLFGGNPTQPSDDNPVGKWNKSGLVWSLNADHTFTFLNGNSSISGKYTVEGDQLTIVDESATGYAQLCGTDKKGVYKFIIKDKILTLTEVQDPCTDRIKEVIGTYNRQLPSDF